MYIQKAIESLLADRDIRRSVHNDLRAACEEALKDLEKEDVNANSANSGTVDEEDSSSKSKTRNGYVLPEVVPVPLRHVPLDKVFVPFELACTQNRNARLVISALDSIQKLVAYGHIRFDYLPPASRNAVSAPGSPASSKASSPTHGSGSGSGSGKEDKKRFDDRLVHLVANCFTGPQTDEGIQLQVLKALLTILTSPHVRVHDNSLLLAVRTCYNIYLARYI